MKKILFDLTRTQPLGSIKIHGGGKYGIVVCRALIKGHAEKLSVYYNPNLYIDKTLKDELLSYKIECHEISEGHITDVAAKLGYAIYTPLFSDDYLCNPDVTVIATIHGLRDIEMPYDSYEKYYQRKRGLLNMTLLFLRLERIRKWLMRNKNLNTLDKYKRWMENTQCHFVTVSEHSKASLMNFIPFVESKDLTVLYSPSTIDPDLTLVKSNYNCQKYWLMVSGGRWQKNCLRAIEAFDKLFTERPQLEGKVLITGLNNLNFRCFKIKNPDRFVALGYVDENRLKVLYQDAYALVYPSLNEGFGYPPLEAMYEGTPVITSAICSIPEVCGDAVLYFNPMLINEIKMRILQLEDPQTYSHYAKVGKERQRIIEERQNQDLHRMCEFLLSYTI